MQQRRYRHARRRPGTVGLRLDPHGFAAALACERGFVVLAGGVTAIPLRRGKGLTEEFAVVSFEDRHLGRFYWSKNNWSYARRRDKHGRGVMMHREVMGLVIGDEMHVDHINRDRLDNRRENLRLVTQAENAQNQGARSHSTSAHRGVSFRSRDRKWVVNHRLNGKQHYIGAFDSEDEAVAAAVAWRREHMPFANTSEYRGVSYDRTRGKWRAQARLNYAAIHIGRFDTEEEAVAARRAWEREHMPFSTD